MAITDTDIRWRQSVRMTDTADGGGPMAAAVVVDGEKNNVWPDLNDLERATGRTQLRKVFGHVGNAAAELFSSAHVVLDDGPDDAATTVVHFGLGNMASAQADAVAALAASTVGRLPLGTTGLGTIHESTVTAVSGNSTLTYMAATFENRTSVWVSLQHADGVYIDRAESIVDGLVTLERTLPFSGSCLLQVLAVGAQRCHGVMVSSAGAASGATSIGVDAVWQRVVPVDLAQAYPSANNPAWGIDGQTSGMRASGGRVPVVADQDVVLLHHTATVGPQTVSNGQTVNVGRITLARLVLVGHNGAEIARFVRHVAPPSGVGCTADLDAGTITITDTSGMSQPVTIVHRIEELRAVTHASAQSLVLSAALARAWPAGTKVSSLRLCGDLQGRVLAGFAQTAWTGAWSDALVGSAPLADFNAAVYPITTTNAGAITQRWVIQFTGTTTFRMFGEEVGEVGTGSTVSTFAPINPATGAPYLTINPAGWGSGWATGNVYRVNTEGAVVPAWLARCVAPSAPYGADSATPGLRGYINA